MAHCFGHRYVRQSPSLTLLHNLSLSKHDCSLPTNPLPGCASCRGCSRRPHRRSRTRPSWVSTNASRRSRNLHHDARPLPRNKDAADQASPQELHTAEGEKTENSQFVVSNSSIQFPLSDSQFVVCKSSISLRLAGAPHHLETETETGANGVEVGGVGERPIARATVESAAS